MQEAIKIVRVGEPLVITDEPLPHLIKKRAERSPEATAIVLGGVPISYGEVGARSAEVASFLSSLGVDRGASVAIFAGNSPEFIFAWLGIMCVGAVEVPINPEARGARLAYILADSRSSVLFCEAELLPHLRSVELPSTLRTLVVIGAEHDPREPLAPPITTYRYDDCSVPTVDAEVVHEDIRLSDVAAIIYTSGTTGPSKGVKCPHSLLQTLGLDTIDMFSITPADTLYDGHPLFHAHGQGQVVYTGFAVGIPVILCRKFSASRFVQDLYDCEVTVAFLIGAAALVLKQDPSALDRRLQLRMLCAVPVPRGSLVALEDRFGVPVIETYGMTELGVISYTTAGSARDGSCGRPTPRREVRIADEHDRTVGVGEMGEILVRPRDEWSVMTGYFGKPEDTVASWQNLWFHTGDLGYLDKDNNIFFVGRKKDSIRRRGENISAYEVELALLSHERVIEAAVLPWPSPLGEDDVWAVIVKRPGAEVTAEEITAHCVGRLDSYAIPRFVSFETELPKTPTERIEKYKLKERGLPADAFDRETQRISGS